MFLAQFQKSFTQVLYTIGISDFYLKFWDQQNLKIPTPPKKLYKGPP